MRPGAATDSRATPRFGVPHGAVVVGGLVLGALLGALVSFLLPRPYVSTAELLVAGSDSGATARATTYARLADSRALAASLPGGTAEALRRTDTQVVPGTLLLRVRATGDSAAQARALANGVTTALPALISTVDPTQEASSSVRVVREASQPTDRATPALGRALVIGGVVGLLLGLVAALGLAFRRRSIETPADVTRSLDTPVLGHLPVSGQPTRQTAPDAATHQALATVRENLRYLGVDSTGRVLLVVAPRSATDAAETAAALAADLARDSGEVLLVDADLRTPSVNGVLGLDLGPGLTDVLVGDSTLAEAIQQHRASGLAVLTSGQRPPNPGELTGSTALAGVLGEARESYATIVVVAPPASSGDDVLRVGRRTDGVLVVARTGETSEADLLRLSRRLSAADIALRGVVLARLAKPRRGAVLRAQQFEHAFPPQAAGPAVSPATAAVPAPATTAVAPSTDPVAETESAPPAAASPAAEVPEPAPWPAAPDPGEESVELTPSPFGDSARAPLEETQPIDPVELMESWPGLEAGDQPTDEVAEPVEPVEQESDTSWSWVQQGSLPAQAAPDEASAPPPPGHTPEYATLSSLDEASRIEDWRWPPVHDTPGPQDTAQPHDDPLGAAFVPDDPSNLSAETPTFAQVEDTLVPPVAAEGSTSDYEDGSVLEQFLDEVEEPADAESAQRG